MIAPSAIKMVPRRTHGPIGGAPTDDANNEARAFGAWRGLLGRVIEADGSTSNSGARPGACATKPPAADVKIMRRAPASPQKRCG